jgi:hypothetical protein
MKRRRSGVTTINFEAPKQLQEELREVATRNERTVSAELRLAARAHLDSQPRVKKQAVVSAEANPP